MMFKEIILTALKAHDSFSLILTNPGLSNPQLQVHDVVIIELLQTLVDVVLKDRCVCDQPRESYKDLLEPLPGCILCGKSCFRVIREKRKILHQTEGCNEIIYFFRFWNS